MSTVISLVSYPFLPAKLGGQKGIALFNKYFSRHCRLLCITTQKNNPAAAEGYQVLNVLPDSPLRYINIFLFFTLRRQIKKQQASHLVLEHPYFGWLGILLKWATGIQLVVHSHNIESTRWKTLGKWWWPILSLYEKKTHQAARYNFFIREEDRAFAIETFKLPPSACLTVTYGIEWNTIPAATERQSCRQQLEKLYGILPGTTLFLFNGSLDYAPNAQAVTTILEKINPLLFPGMGAYKIIICGKGLPAGMHELAAYSDKNIIYAGFVDDISIYFKGADTFINPVIDGGGIKTKLVEALGYNLNVVTTVSGAMGVPAAVTGNKMTVLADNDWTGFAAAMQLPPDSSAVPTAFFDHFYWDTIATKAWGFIQG